MAVRRLFWDIETSPNIGYFWEAGYKITIPYENIIKERAIICIAYKWENQKTQALTWKDGCDKQLVKDFLKIAEAADELVAHNGDNFDLKWFNARCVKHGIIAPEFKTVDTLQIARRRFRFNSNRLDYIAKHLLGVGKIQTNFKLWIDVCNGSEKALGQMVRYCKRDVALLERVWRELQKYHKPKTHWGVAEDRDRWSCPECGSENVLTTKTSATPSGMKRFEMKCKDCLRRYSIARAVHEQYNTWRLSGAKPNEPRDI